MFTDKIKDFLNNSDRYSGFTFLKKPMPFREFFADKNFDCVQLHTLSPVDEEDESKGIIGFCGTFKWQDGNLAPLDGDSYNDNVLVYGYSEWSHPEQGGISGLDILVGNDW